MFATQAEGCFELFGNLETSLDLLFPDEIHP